jgi:DsbC/DsbD-like thiol-disulfide interchange protein
MTTKICAYVTSLSLAVIFSACSKGSGEATSTKSVPAQGGVTSVKVVKASAAETQLPAGGSAEASVTLMIQNGYHVNANPPSFPYLRATEITVQPGEGLSVGFITYPTALTKKFSFADQPLAVYEGNAVVKVMLKATATATKGQRSLPAKVQIQACDDQVCYAPGTLELSLPVIVK